MKQSKVKFLGHIFQFMEPEVLDETELDDFHLYCPSCGGHVARMSVTEDIQEYRAPCPICDAELSTYSVVAVPLGYFESSEVDDFEEKLKETVIEHWEKRLEDGIKEKKTMEGAFGPTYETKEIEEEVDYTEEYAEVFYREARSFGWDWKPPEIVPTEIKENNAYRNTETNEVYKVISISDAPEGGSREVRSIVEKVEKEEEENAVMSMEDFEDMIEEGKIVRVFEGESYLM